jgi:hypothetical protein
VGRSEVAFLVRLLDQGFDRRAWHGPNLIGSLRGVEVDEALFRPNLHRHNIWELAVHAAYWKYAVRRRLTREKRGSFAFPGSNFFPRPDERGATAAAWRDDLKLLRAEHRALRAVIEGLRPGDLGQLSPRKKWTAAETVAGIASHDIYHAGQIQILRRLYLKR